VIIVLPSQMPASTVTCVGGFVQRNEVLRCSACGPGLTLAAAVVVVVVEAAGALA